MRNVLLIFVIFISGLLFSAKGATIIVPPGGNIQAAINTAQCVDTIILQDGGTYETPADFVAYRLPAKGCTTDIWIRRSGPIPPDGTPVTLADRASMPKLVVKKGSGFFEADPKAGHYRLSGLWFTNKLNGTTTQLLSNGNIERTDPRDPGVDWPQNITIDHNWFNPAEWDLYPDRNLCSSVNTAIGMVGINVTIRDNVMKGFGAKYGSGLGADQPQCGSVPLDGESVLIGTAPGPMLVDNNQMEEWFVAFFIGGGDPGSIYGGTVMADPVPTLTSATLSNVNGLKVGENIAFEMNVDSPTFAGLHVAAGTITGISGNNVTYTRLVGKWGTNDNYIQIPDGAVRPKTVADSGGVAPCSLNYLGIANWCSRAYWGGYNPSNITITHNYINKPQRWYDYAGTDGKGFFEIKLCDTCLIDGNIFDGKVGFTVTVRNQGGRAPWSAIKNLTISNNLATQFSAGLYTLFFDNEQLSTESENIVFENNLMYGEYDNSAQSGFRPRVFTGTYGRNVKIRHNTILQSGRIMTYGNSPDYAGIDELTGFEFTDNIVGWGTGEGVGYVCLDGPINVCTPGYVWNKNAMIGAPTGPISERQSLATFPGNFNPPDIASVGFTDPAKGDYKLLTTSPYYKKASDGKDVGVDMDQLLAHLNGPIPIPTSTPTPAPTASPSPSPTPSPLASPSPTPVIVSIPSGSQVEIISPANVRDIGSISGSVIRIAQTGERGTSGTCQPDTASLSVYCFVDFVEGADGYVASQFLRVVAEPSPSPSPSPTPTPLPTPSPQPPTCDMAITAPVMAPWSTGTLTVTVNSSEPLSFTVSAIGESGQVVVGPPTISPLFINTTSGTAQFKLQSKKKSGNAMVLGPCGSKTVQIVVR